MLVQLCLFIALSVGIATIVPLTRQIFACVCVCVCMCLRLVMHMYQHLKVEEEVNGERNS